MLVSCAHKTHFDKNKLCSVLNASGPQRSRASMPIIWRHKSTLCLLSLLRWTQFTKCEFCYLLILFWKWFTSLFSLLPRFALLHFFHGTPNDLHRVSVRYTTELFDCDCRNNGHRVYLRLLFVWKRWPACYIVQSYTNKILESIERSESMSATIFVANHGENGEQIRQTFSSAVYTRH